MSARVQLPPGNFGFQMQDGTHYRGKPGGHVEVSDEHASAIRKQVGGDAGLVSCAGSRVFAGSPKRGRWCYRCNFLANAWSTICPRCQVTETIPELEMPEQPRSSLPSDCVMVTARIGT